MGVTPLPQRAGPPPTTTDRIPHHQVDQQPSDGSIRDRLAARAFALPGVREQESAVSVAGARALVLDEGVPAGPPEAFFVGREFAHLHPGPDFSLHVALPEDLAAAVAAAGWGEPHYLVAAGQLPPTIMMIYAPRDDTELDVVWQLVESSYRFAVGVRDAPAPPLATKHDTGAATPSS